MTDEKKDIPMDKIKILENIRTGIGSDEDFSSLMMSIKQNGLLQPIGLYKDGDEYVVVFGNRRLQALRKLGWKILPKENYNLLEKGIKLEDFLTLNTSENIHRKDIAPLELGKICSRLREIGMSLSEISVRLSLPKKRVEQAYYLYGKVPERLKEKIGYVFGLTPKAGKISPSVVETIAKLRISQEIKNEIFDIADKNDFTIRKVRLLDELISENKMSLKNALKIIDNCHQILVTLAIDKNVEDEMVKKYKMSPIKIVREMLYGRIPLRKDFIVSGN